MNKSKDFNHLTELVVTTIFVPCQNPIKIFWIINTKDFLSLQTLGPRLLHQEQLIKLTFLN